MSGKTSLLFVTFCVISAIHGAHGENSGVQATCGLTGIPTDTSTSNFYFLPTISDNLNPDSETVVWDHPYFGSVKKTAVNPSSDFRYMTARIQSNTNTYQIISNTLSWAFTRREKRREMTRYITFTCRDDSTIRYFFKTPVQDMTPPVFEKDEYTFDITSDWDHARPISEGQFVIVRDNAFELNTTQDFNLRFEGSLENTLKFSVVKLWVPELLPEEEDYYHRLDIFLDESVSLTPGQSIQMLISAKDEFNTGLTKININVS